MEETPTLKEIAFGDLERELTVTRTVLDRLPPEQYNWKPHEKSMSLAELALHVAELPAWIRVTLAGDELDAASAPRLPAEVMDKAELLARFDENARAVRESGSRMSRILFISRRYGSFFIPDKRRPI